MTMGTGPFTGQPAPQGQPTPLQQLLAAQRNGQPGGPQNGAQPNRPGNPPQGIYQQSGVDPFGPPGPQYGNSPAMQMGVGQDFGGLGPMSYEQLQALYQDPNAAQNYQAIAGMQGQQLQGYGPGGSSLAGLTQMGPMQNSQAARIDAGRTGQLYGQQLQNIGQLQQQAMGQGPSVAEQQAKQWSEEAIKAQMGVIGSQRGAANSALGLRQAGDQAAQMIQQGVQAGAQARVQEELAARQQLTGALGGMQEQQGQQAQAQAALEQQTNLSNQQAQNEATMQQAQMNQQTALANLQAQLQAGQINADQYNAMVQAQMAESNNQMSAAMNFGGLITNENTQLQGIGQGLAINSSNNQLGMMGAGIGGAAALGAGALQASSDERLKSHIRRASKPLKAFLERLVA